MTEQTYPSPVLQHRRADQAVHLFGLVMILTAGTIVISKALGLLDTSLVIALVVYVLCALASKSGIHRLSFFTVARASHAFAPH